MKFFNIILLLLFFNILSLLRLSGQNRIIDSLNSLLIRSSVDSIKLELHWQLCEKCAVTENLKYGLAGVKFSNALLSKKPDSTIYKLILTYKVRFLETIRGFYDENRNIPKVISYSQNIYAIYKELQDTINAEQAKVEIARNLHKSGNTSTAFDTLKARLRYYETIGSNRFMAFYYKNIALAYDQNNNYHEALFYNKKALHLYELLKREKAAAEVLMSMAQAYDCIHQPMESLDCALKSLEIYKKDNNPTELYWVYYRLTGLYNQFKDFSKAHKYNQNLLDIAIGEKDTVMLSNAYSFFASTYKAENDIKNYTKYEIMSYEIIKNGIAKV